MESRFADPSFAKRAYTAIIKRTIDYGVRLSTPKLDRSRCSGLTPIQSTTCCYYGTLHLEGTQILADVIHGYGSYLSHWYHTHEISF